MKQGTLHLMLWLMLFALTQVVFSQDDQSLKIALQGDSVANTSPEKQSVKFTREQALRYLQDTYDAGYWKDFTDPLRQNLGQLLFFATHEKSDSVIKFMLSYPFEDLNIAPENFLVWDSINAKVPVLMPVHFERPADSVIKKDTISFIVHTDSLQEYNVRAIADSVLPFLPGEKEPAVFLKDTVFVTVTDTLSEYQSFREDLPFAFFRYPNLGDSLSSAINVLSEYLERRDSSEIIFKGTSSSVVPVWLNSKSERMIRYWLMNEFGDSVTIWIGTFGRNTIGLFLEEGISFRRPVKQTTISDAQLNLREINSGKLQDINKIYVKPQYWKLRSEASFVLNQASLTNWVKGGESSISTLMDITGYADYNNKQLKLVSNHFARLKYGLVASGDKGVRKNIDLLETNSKLNHKAFGKFDFSATMLFKTQIAKGYNYPNDSVAVSKFLNPATLTIGLGLDFKPNKKTSINFAPLSYKGTFVTDTANIDQTKYGILKDKKSLHEPGASLQISYDFDPFKFLNVKNRVQFFTNYINKPQNIDVDWELIATAKINWFTEVKLNTHLIFDDDTRIPVTDKKGLPVIGPDGKQKKTARVQFKELLGFSFVFRF